jgi:hypothetical protein
MSKPMSRQIARVVPLTHDLSSMSSMAERLAIGSGDSHQGPRLTSWSRASERSVEAGIQRAGHCTARAIHTEDQSMNTSHQRAGRGRRATVAKSVCADTAGADTRSGFCRRIRPAAGTRHPDDAR